MSRAPDSLWKAARSAYGALMALPAARRAKGVVVQRLDRGDWTAWAKLATGDRLRVDLANTVGRTILVRGSYDRDLVEFVTDPLEPGSVFIDVGESGDRLVPGLPLDLAVRPLVAQRHVASIKIDVEGHELEAIDGMWKLLSEHRPERILAEAHPHYGRPWLERLFGRLRSLGYDAVDPRTSSLITPDQVSTSLWNVGFVRQQA